MDHSLTRRREGHTGAGGEDDDDGRAAASESEGRGGIGGRRRAGGCADAPQGRLAEECRGGQSVVRRVSDLIPPAPRVNGCCDRSLAALLLRSARLIRAGELVRREQAAAQATALGGDRTAEHDTHATRRMQHAQRRTTLRMRGRTTAPPRSPQRVRSEERSSERTRGTPLTAGPHSLSRSLQTPTEFAPLRRPAACPPTRPRRTAFALLALLFLRSAR